jgi:hypothetical protein
MSFKEYDQALEQRNSRLRELVDSSLEKIIKKDSKISKRTKKVERSFPPADISIGFDPPANLVTIIVHSPMGELHVDTFTSPRLKTKMDECTQRAEQQTSKELYLKLFENAKSSGKQAKEELYKRVHYQHQQIGQLIGKEIDLPEHTPKNKAEVGALVIATKALAREGYFPNNHVKYIGLIFQKNSKDSEKPPVQIKYKIKSEDKNEKEFKTRSGPSAIEYLSNILPPETARQFSHLNLKDLRVKVRKLERRLGQYAHQVIQENPEIITYDFATLNSYLRLFKKVRSHVDIPSNLETISTLEGLQHLEKKRQQKAPVKVSAVEPNINLGVYQILHKGDKLVESRLDQLINQGTFSVNDHEYMSCNKSGARSGDILKKYMFQLRASFSEMGLPEPQIELNFGQKTLTVSKQDQGNLATLRAWAYQRQK